MPLAAAAGGPVSVISHRSLMCSGLKLTALAASCADPAVASSAEPPETSGSAEGAALEGYVVVFEGDGEAAYSAYSPDLPDVVAAGETRAETEQLMLEATAEHIALLQQAGEPVPEPADADSVTLLDPAAAWASLRRVAAGDG